MALQKKSGSSHKATNVSRHICQARRGEGKTDRSSVFSTTALAWTCDTAPKRCDGCPRSPTQVDRQLPPQTHAPAKSGRTKDISFPPPHPSPIHRPVVNPSPVWPARPLIVQRLSVDWEPLVPRAHLPPACEHLPSDAPKRPCFRCLLTALRAAPNTSHSHCLCCYGVEAWLISCRGCFTLCRSCALSRPVPDATWQSLNGALGRHTIAHHGSHVGLAPRA